jgi:hypothetical protein
MAKERLASLVVHLTKEELARFTAASATGMAGRFSPQNPEALARRVLLLLAENRLRQRRAADEECKRLDQPMFECIAAMCRANDCDGTRTETSRGRCTKCGKRIPKTMDHKTRCRLVQSKKKRNVAAGLPEWDGFPRWVGWGYAR